MSLLNYIVSSSTTTSTSTPTQQAQSSGVGPTAALNQDPFSLGQNRFPLNGLGTDDVPHYVVFNINLPTSSKYLKNNSVQVGSGTSASTQNYNTLSSQGGTYQPVTSDSQIAAIGTLSGVDGFLKGGVGSGVEEGIGATVGGALLSTLSLSPKLQRIKESIAIYMPETVAMTYSHTWEGVSATEAGGDAGKYAQIGGSFKGAVGDLKDIGSTLYNNIFTNKQNKSFNSVQSAELAASLVSDTGAIGKDFSDLYLKGQGKAINPHVEMLFRKTDNRQSSFIFHFIPRSQQEAQAIQNIIRVFKTYAAPEVSAEAGGRYFIPPGQFDISFYFKGQENTNIARLSTCALTQITVNYSGVGTWTTFNDGQPLKIDLEMQFTEMDVITRELILKYGY